MEMKPEEEGGSHAVPLSWHARCVPAASHREQALLLPSPALPAPLTGPGSVTHLGAPLPLPCLMQVDNHRFFFFPCSALKIRWLVALFSHAEELTLSHILPCPPLTHHCAQAKHCPSRPGLLGCRCSPSGDGELWKPPDGPVARRAAPTLRHWEVWLPKVDS